MLEDLIEDRKKKLRRLEERGIDPYPARVRRTHTIAEVCGAFGTLARTKKQVAIAGRIVGWRDQGKIVFCDIRDVTGEMQVVFREGVTRELPLFKATLDRGDFISVSGVPFATKRGEQSIEARTLTIVAKSLRPVPATFYGLEDTETLLRKRYLDLIAHPERRELFIKKAVFWSATRDFLEREGFLEVETPALEAVPGGAEAEPFTTHHNALKQDFYLRISLELKLKRLMVAGFEKVFEIGRIFRNEGIDAEHLQDFTFMELYWAYQDYKGLMRFVERMYKAVVEKTTGGFTTMCQGKKINWSKKWSRLDYYTLFKKATNLDLHAATKEALLKEAKKLGVERASARLGRGRLIDLIYKKVVRPALLQPAFLVNHPVDVSPLSKRIPDDPDRVERFQVVACGTELGNGYTELNDPVDQRKRLEEQMRLRTAGDREAHMLDEDYLEAMEYGMPPTAGFGMSERFFAVLMDRPVRETTLFPLMRDKT